MTLIILMSLMLLTSLFLLVISLINKKKLLTIISSFLILANIAFSVIYFVLEEKELFESIYNIYLVCYVLFFLIILSIYLIETKTQNKNQTMLLNEINNSGYSIYLITDGSLKIETISNDFLKQLGQQENKIKRKKIYDVFKKYIHINKINDLDITNENLKDYYLRYQKYEIEEEIIELKYLSFDAKKETLILTVKPIYEHDVFKNLLLFGYLKSNNKMVNVNANLDSAINELESIQYKFIATLETSSEAIFFNDLKNNSIWGNNNWSKMLNTRNNEMSIIDYKALIHQDDVSFYIETLRNLTKESPTYEVRYRLFIDNHYEFIYEKGKRIFEDKNEDIILGNAKIIPANFFEYTGIKELDDIKHMYELKTDVNKLITNNHGFQLICIHLTNLPEINKEYGREFGNLLLGEYIKQLNMNFKSASNNIYRQSGLVFYLTLTDSRKMEFFKRSLLTNSESMNFSINVGGHKVTLKVSIGVSEFNSDGSTYEELLANNTKAINMALNPQYQSNFVYYKDLKNIGIGY